MQNIFKLCYLYKIDKMRTLKAILLGVLLWILIFVEISVFVIGLKLTGIVQYIIHYIFLIVFTIICTAIYYKSRDKINGFVLGIFWLLVGNILDLIITIPGFTAKQYSTLSAAYSGFYSNTWLWAGFLVVVVVTGIYDMTRKKR